jgi:hypothetical protein
MALDEVTTQPIHRTKGTFEIDPVPRFERTQVCSLEGFRTELHGESGRLDRDGRETAAIDGDALSHGEGILRLSSAWSGPGEDE